MRIQRNYTVDIMRVIAAFGVIAIHVKADTPSAKAIGNFFSPLCVPFFFTASLVYFVAGIKPDVSVPTVLSKLFTRILVPYFAWTIIYMLLMAGQSVLTHQAPHFVWWKALFYGESAVQMYYLPDLFAFQIIALGIYLLLMPAARQKMVAALLLAAGILFLWIGNYYHCFGMSGGGIALKFGFFILSGFLLSFLITNMRFQLRYVAGGIALVLFSVVAKFADLQYALMGYPVTVAFGGAGLMLIAIGAPLQQLPSWLANLSSDTYGVYLSHVMFLEVFEKAVALATKGNIVYDLWIKLSVVVLLFVVAVVFTRLVRNFSFLKQVLLGEKRAKLGAVKATVAPTG